jgi:hypothetical protein
MLKERKPYQPQNIETYSKQQRDRYLKRLQRQAKKLGMHLVSAESVS